MPKRRKRNDLAVMEEVMQASGGRSPLYRWLRLHHDWFAARIEGERPDWQAIADGFTAKLGIRSANGQPLKGPMVRHAWWRVRRDVQAARAKRPVSVTPVVRLIAPLSPFPPPAPPEPEPPQAGGEAMARLWADVNKRSGR